MRKTALAVFIALGVACAASGAHGQLRQELGPLEFLVGWCWQGEFPDGVRVDTHCFEAIFDGQHVRDRHAVTGGATIYQGETVYSWNANEQTISYVYWNSIGGVSTGTATADDDGSIVFPDEAYAGGDGQRVTVSTSWRNISDTGYDSLTIERYENGQTSERTTRFERQPFMSDPAQQLR